MSEPIILALIGMAGLQLSAIIKGHFDTKKARTEGQKTRATVNAIEQSINNRPTSISDRLDAIKSEVTDGFAAVNTDLAAVHVDVQTLTTADATTAGQIDILEKSVAAQWQAINARR
jgi:hypothetical protein